MSPTPRNNAIEPPTPAPHAAEAKRAPAAAARHTAHPGARMLHSQRSNYQRPATRYLPTLFDRLFDDAPSEKSEASSAYTPSRSQMRAIMQRDLAFLLNTTNQSDLIDATRHPEVIKSTVNYGVAPIAGGYLSEKKWADIETMIREAIAHFEPRLIPDSLVVRPLLKDQASAHYNVLTFEIYGLVQMQPYPMEFTVQSAVDLETQRIVLNAKHT